MKTFTPIAMKCTQEQWDSIKGRIPEKMINSVTSFKKYSWIFIDKTGQISNIRKGEYRKKIWSIAKETYETFNAKIFLEACGIDVEPTYKITKETVIKYNMKDEFPDALKKELEVGKWMKTPIGGLYCPKEKQGNGFICYGFTPTSRTYKEIFVLLYITKNDTEATPQEVEAALISEWEKNNKNVFEIDNSSICELGGKYKISNKPTHKYWEANNMLTIDEVCVFLNGQWATIIQPEKMTLEQIEKELGRKIEIV